MAINNELTNFNVVLSHLFCNPILRKKEFYFYNDHDNPYFKSYKRGGQQLNISYSEEEDLL